MNTQRHVAHPPRNWHTAQLAKMTVSIWNINPV